MKYFVCILSVFIFIGTLASAQFYEFGQDPASLKWKQINTEHFQVVFSSDFGNTAQKLANLLEKNYKANSNQLDHSPRKVPVIIHNQTVYSNAFVTWAPKRMEFFTFPDPNIYPIDWLTELSLHEFRHVVQIDKLNQNFTRFLTVLLGQQANGIVAGMMPLWFIEGDAVSAETSLSQSGRGRLPSFEMEIKAKLLSDTKPYSLSKAYLGSYKDYVPDHYQLGYQMVSYARKHYGNDYWTNALNYVSRHPYLISPYYFYSRKTTGGGQGSLYKNTMNSLKDHWTFATDRRKPEPKKILNTRDSKVYTSYTQTHILSDSSVIALKSGLNIIPRFVKVFADGTEKFIFNPGSLVSGRFSVYGNKIIWDEYVQDVRWTNRSFSIIREFNIDTGKSRNLTKKTKYTSPSWSSLGDIIVAVNSTVDYKFSLVFLSSVNGKVIKQVQSPENAYLQYPEWIGATGKIAVIASGDKGKSIMEYDLYTNKWTEILNTGFVNIEHLNYSGDFLFFNGGFDGIDEIYSVNLIDKKLRKHSNSALGSYNPDVNNDYQLMSYSAYGLNGYDIVLENINPHEQEEYFLKDSITEQSFISVNLKEKPDTLTISQANDIKFEEKHYSKAVNLFRLHSWAPYWFDYTEPDIDDPKVSAGFTLLSQNDLSTAVSSLGFEHNSGVNYLHTRFTYKGLLPVFDFSATYGGEPFVAVFSGLTEPVLNTNLFYNLSTYIPLTFTSGKIITGMQPSFNASYNSTYFYHFSDKEYKRGIRFIEPRVYFYSYKRTSVRDLQPRLGITADGRFTSSPFENELYGSIKSFKTSLYLPGILMNHGLRLRGEWQNQEIDMYYYPNHLSLPRGIPQRPFIDMNRYSADYVFPVCYPDWSLGSLLYLKRLRGNLFTDYMKGIEKFVSPTETSAPEHILTQGLELYADYHILRFIFEFSTGARFIYFPNEENFGVQLLFSVNLDKFL